MYDTIQHIFKRNKNVKEAVKLSCQNLIQCEKQKGLHPVLFLLWAEGLRTRQHSFIR